MMSANQSMSSYAASFTKRVNEQIPTPPPIKNSVVTIDKGVAKEIKVEAKESRSFFDGLE